MDKFDYESIVHDLNRLQWLDYKLTHAYSVKNMNPLCLYLLLRLYYCSDLSFYDFQKLAYCHALCTIHFTELVPNDNDYGLDLTYKLTPIGRKFVKRCIRHHFLMFCIEYTTVGVKKILYILLSLMFVIAVLNYHSVSALTGVLANLGYVALCILCLISCAIMMLLILTDADPILTGTQIEHVNKHEFITFMNRHRKHNIDYSKIIDVIEYSLFSEKN